jgi:pimeloyl-ACP methyl ester carboxylesterase
MKRSAAPNGHVVVRYRTVDVDGLEIFFREAGPPDAPALLLLHGFPSSSHMFRDLIPLLADRYHVVAPDYPGFGSSATPPLERFRYTFDRLTDVVEAFTNGLDLRRYVLYMQDYGGPVGFRLATRHPDRVAAMVIQNANAYDEGVTDVLRDVVLRIWAERTPETEAKLRTLFEPAAIKAQFTAGAHDQSLVSPDSWQHALWSIGRPGNEAIQFALQADYGSNIERYDEWHRYFRRYQPPALVVWGRGDIVFAPDGATAYGRDLETVDVRLLDAGHFALETKAFEIAQLMRAFLCRHAAE